MSRQDVLSMTADLPYTFRELIVGYVDSVAEAMPEIFRDADIRPTPRLEDEFLFAVGLRKFWSLVDSQYWLLVNSLDILEEQGVTGISLRGKPYTRQSEELRGLRQLRLDLERVIDRSGLSYVMQGPLSEMLLELARNGRRRSS